VARPLTEKGASVPNGGVDVLFTNATVASMRPSRSPDQAIAIRGDRISWVGSNAEAERDLGTVHRTVDLGGATVLPGFVDAHNHLILLGHWLNQVDCSASAVQSIPGIAEAFGERTRSTPAGTWIEGRGYDDTRLVERRHPTRADLDAATPDHPVLLHHVSGHMSVVNSRGLELAGIGPDALDPIGGVIVRDPGSGEPTGLLQEQAISLLPVPFTPQDPIALKDSLRAGGLAYLAAGVTSTHEAGIFSAPELGAFQAAWAEGWLAQRTYLMFRIDFVRAIEDMGLRGGFGDARLRFGAIKLVADGSLIGRTAAVSEPFLDDPASDNLGILTIPPDELDELIWRGHTRGWQMAVHAIGDRAIEAALNGFERAMVRLARPDPRHRIEHCGVLRPDLIARIRDLGVVPVSQPAFITEFGDGFLRHLGRDRCQLTYPLRALLDEGIPVAGSSDSPVSSYQPLFGIQAAVMETTADGDPFALKERLTVEEAIRMYTSNAAYASFDEAEKGTLEVGKLADLVVLARNPTTVPVESIASIPVLATVVGGEIAYERPIAG
jgi:predicted amidohydrolase YtcJ